MNPTLEEICTVVRLNLGLKQVQATDRLLEDLGAQSIDVMNIVTAVERKYGIFIEESVIPQISTVADLQRIVQTGLEAK